jgi:peptide/nickel transport system ATP-binding protein
MNLLEIKNFSLQLKQEDSWNTILSSLSFSLKKGETLGVVGESGSGKSVTALSIKRLLSEKRARIVEGGIYFDEMINLTKSSEKELQQIRGNRIAMIFQEPMTSLNPVIKCGKQITEALLLHTNLSKKEAKQKTLELFEDVQLTDMEKVYRSYPHELSGGQKQRVMIAMAMCCNPDILIADEPTTALDVTVQKNILELLKQLQEKHGMSIIFISHDLGVIAQIAHRVVVMRKGVIVEQGEVQHIFKNPQHPYTKGLLACRPKLDEKPHRLPTVEDFLITNYELRITKGDAEGRREKVESGKQKAEGGASTSLSDQRQKAECRMQKAEREKGESNLAVFQIQNLTKFYSVRKRNLFEKQSYFQALEEVNLDIYEGETLGLVGESGCGKTTLGRALLRLIEPNSGKILYKGIDVRALSDKALRQLRKEVQIILQDPYSSLNQRLTIGQMLLEPMKVHHILNNTQERRKRAIDLLERVGLAEAHLYRYPHEFSGGQRQRIAIARALTVNPKFIVCDESVSALDVSVQAQVLNLLNDLKQEFQLTYLFISHDLSVVKYMSDRIAVMQNGKIVELNDAETIYKNPQTEYTKRLIEAIPTFIN